MAGTTMAAFKTALVAAITAEGSINVPVSYGDPGDLGRREHIWLGATTPLESETVSFKAGRKRRQESYSVEVVIEVLNDSHPEDAETRACALSAIIEEMLADDPKVNAVTNLLFAVLEDMEMETTQTGEGVRTVLTMSVRVEARLL